MLTTAFPGAENRDMLQQLSRGIRLEVALMFGKVRTRADTGAVYIDARPHGRIEWTLLHGAETAGSYRLSLVFGDWPRTSTATDVTIQTLP